MISWNEFEKSRERRGPDCLSALRLDQLALLELPATDRQAAELHLTTCAACRDTAERHSVERRRFLSEAKVTEFATAALAAARQPNREEPRDFPLASSGRAPLSTWLRRLIPATGLAGGLAAAALLLFPARPDMRAKGGFSLAAYVKHSESSREGVPHAREPLHPGDRMLLSVSSDQPGHLVVVAVDTTNEVSVYFPPGPKSEEIGATTNQTLRTAVELDQTLGKEVIIAVRCPTPIAVNEVTAAVRRALVAARDGASPKLGRLDLPCAETRYEITKSLFPPPATEDPRAPRQAAAGIAPR